MLGAALDDPDPVIILEHNALYSMRSKVAPPLARVPLEGATVRRPGQHVSIIAYGGSVPKALQAASSLAEEGIEAEVIDLRSLRPLDSKTILESVGRTSRAVVVDEMWKTGSFAAEIVAQIAEQAFYDLDAPVARVCTVEVPIPYARHLEQAALPDSSKIVSAVKGLFKDV
jgi:pyruvate dehydrogenase E1 component beta subunit